MLEQIRDILLLHNGKRNPITSAEIARKIGIVEDDTHAQTRTLILECAENLNCRWLRIIGDIILFQTSKNMTNIWTTLIRGVLV